MPSFITILAGVVTLLAVGIYLFGIPPELKRKMERAALKTMGENKASYLVKGSTIPSSYLIQSLTRTRSNREDAGFGSGERKGSEEGIEQFEWWGVAESAWRGGW